MAGTPAHHVLAILRIRQWADDRTKLRAGIGTNYARTGWRERRLRDADSRIVRVLSFEQALSQLNPAEQAALVAYYRDDLTQRTVARIIGCSPRKIDYFLPGALQHLAEILDRHDLL